MSKIALSPDAAGTGTFTLASPNGNTNRTITLPDGDVTLGAATPSITDNGNATAITIDANENVGIGCVPNSIQSGFDTLQIGGNLTLNVDSTGAGAGVYMGNNVYRDSTNSRWEYINTDEASQYYQANGTHVWRYAASGSANAAISWSEAMRITSAGSVGIGKSGAPLSKLDVSNSFITVSKGAATTGRIGASDYIVGGTDNDFVLQSSGTGVTRFVQSSTEAMRISSGNLMVNTTAVHGTNSKVSVKTEVDKSGIGITAYKSSNSNYYFMNFIANTASVGDIYSNGSSTTYATSSDYRLKENTVSLTGASERVNQLLPKRFNFINDETNTLVDGFLAHEVQSVVPEAILGTHDGMKDEEYEVTPAVLDDDGNETTAAVMGTRSVPDYQGIDQSKLVPLLTAALQEALTKIDDMETRLAALEVTP